MKHDKTEKYIEIGPWGAASLEPTWFSTLCSAGCMSTSIEDHAVSSLATQFWDVLNGQWCWEASSLTQDEHVNINSVGNWRWDAILETKECKESNISASSSYLPWWLHKIYKWLLFFSKHQQWMSSSNCLLALDPRLPIILPSWQPPRRTWQITLDLWNMLLTPPYCFPHIS